MSCERKRGPSRAFFYATCCSPRLWQPSGSRHCRFAALRVLPTPRVTARGRGLAASAGTSKVMTRATPSGAAAAASRLLQLRGLAEHVGMAMASAGQLRCARGLAWTLGVASAPAPIFRCASANQGGHRRARTLCVSSYSEGFAHASCRSSPLVDSSTPSPIWRLAKGACSFRCAGAFEKRC